MVRVRDLLVLVRFSIPIEDPGPGGRNIGIDLSEFVWGFDRISFSFSYFLKLNLI